MANIKPEWKIEIGATPISLENQESFNIMLDRNVTNQCSLLSFDMNNVGGKYKTSISCYDEIKFYSRYAGGSYTQEFGGHIDKITYRKTMQGDTIHIDARSYEQQFFFKIISKAYEDSCVEDIITSIVDLVNGNIATNFTYTGVGSAYEQTTINDNSTTIYNDTGGAANTCGQTFKPTKENIITVGFKIIGTGAPDDLVCSLYEWDTDYSNTIDGSLLASDTIAYTEIPNVPTGVGTADNPTVNTPTTIFVLDAIGLDTTKTYLLDFKLSSAGDSSNYYRFGINTGEGLANGTFYEGGSALSEDTWCKFNLFIIDADDKNAFELMRDICNRLGYDWYADTSKDIQLVARNPSASETVITGENIITIDYTRDITPLANNIKVWGAEYPITHPSTIDDLTEPTNQTWVDNNWLDYTPDGASTASANMVDTKNTAAYGEKYVELVCADKTCNDYLKYPKTSADTVDSKYHTIYFIMRAGDKEYPSPIKIRLEIDIHDINNNTDTFYRDIITEGHEWKEYQFKLPHVESVEGWTGVNRFGRRWDQVRAVKWYVRYRDAGSLGDGYDSVDIYGASNYVGQKFTADDTDIRQVIIKAKKDDSPGGALTCQVYEWTDDGDAYNDTIGSTLIATGSLAASEFTESAAVVRIPITMQSGQTLTEGTEYLLHFIQAGDAGNDSNDYDIRYDSSTNDDSMYYYANGSVSTGNSIYFTVDYLHRHADYIGIDALTFAGSDIVHATVTDSTSQSNFDTRDYIIRKDDITSTQEAIQKAKQMLRHLGNGSDSWTGSPADTKDVQNNGFVIVPGRNDLKPTDSVTVTYSEGNLNHDFRIDSISQNIGRMTGWTTTLRLAMILPQMSVQEMLQHVITSINEVKLRKPVYKKELTR